ncbi:hypothetical protein [Streptomyces sp. NPDC058861]|uniref:hypothetical protein n=1 Tax=Streptomyces sp. NPDC058861 TaxID=3346653 RepID=UPI0036C0D4D1
MINILLTLVTVLQVASALAALFTVFKPGISGRTRRTAVSVLTAATGLSAITHLMSGQMLYSTLLGAITVLLLITWSRAPRICVCWIRARKSEKPKK